MYGGSHLWTAIQEDQLLGLLQAISSICVYVITLDIQYEYFDIDVHLWDIRINWFNRRYIHK